jgi:hypothetical protein
VKRIRGEANERPLTAVKSSFRRHFRDRCGSGIRPTAVAVLQRLVAAPPTSIAAIERRMRSPAA